MSSIETRLADIATTSRRSLLEEIKWLSGQCAALFRKPLRHAGHLVFVTTP